MPVGNAAVGLVRACHVEPTVTVTAVAVALAAVAGRSPVGVIAVGAAVLAGQLSIGWLNDAVDARRDAAAGRRGKPVVARVISRRAVGVAAIVAAVACVPLSLLSGVVAGAVHLAAVASGWVYDLGLKATVLSVVPYVVAFGLLPAFVVLGLPGQPLPPAWLVAAGALLGAAAHFGNVLPDLVADAATAVRGLPQRLGARASQVGAALFLVAAAGVLAVGLDGALRVLALGAVPVVLVVGFLVGRRSGSRAAFRAVMLVALLDVGLLLAAAPRLSL